MMTEIEFEATAREGFNRIALVSECLCDLETPLSVYLKLAGRDNDTFLRVRKAAKAFHATVLWG